jgi:hypothetical protein
MSEKKFDDEAVSSLKPSLRTVFILHHIEHISVEEISNMLGTSVSSVKRSASAAMRNLLAIVEDKELEQFQSELAKQSPLPEVADVIETVDRLTPDLIRYLKKHTDDLQKLRYDVFEHLVGEFLLQRGFDDVKLVGREAKTSADIIAVQKIHAVNSETRYFVEVKRWKEKVGIEVINAVYGAMVIEQPEHGWSAAMIVSLAGFTQYRKVDSLRLCRLNVLLKQKEDLLHWLEDYEPRGNGLWLPANIGK